MAFILVADAAASNANSYTTVEEADAYHDSRLYTTAWLVSGEVKAKALAMATRMLDANITWSGSASSSTQALAWPRQGMLSRNGFAIPSGEIPSILKDAVAEYARQLLVADRSLDNDIESQGITQIKAGPIELKFREEVARKAVPDAVRELLPPSWIEDDNGITVLKAY